MLVVLFRVGCFSGICLPFLRDFNFEMLKIERVAAFPCILNP